MVKNTRYMVYNLDKHRYILTQDAIAENYNFNLRDILDTDGTISPDAMPNNYLDRVSMILYMYIYSWAQDPDATEYVLSLPKYRDTIQSALLELTYGFIMNNTDPSIYFTGDTLKTIEVNPAVQTILMNGGVLFRGQYFNLPYNYQDLKGVEY